MAPHRRFLFIMDPYQTLNLATETSLLLMEELDVRGIEVYWAEQKDLILDGSELHVAASMVSSVHPLVLDAPGRMPSAAFDAIVTRIDPPFDENYLHLTYLLDFAAPTVKQFNRADALRAYSEKLLPLRWPELAAPTLTTMNVDALADFLATHGDIVLKPLADCSGRGILRLKSDAADARDQLTRYVVGPTGRGRYVMAQAFLPAIAEGDKRVYLVAGEPVGMVNRIPAEGNFLGNIHQGARVEATSLTAEEEAAIARIAPFLREEGLLLVGADFIGGKLTELNITSPSAVRQINAVSGLQLETRIVGAMLDALSEPALSALCCA